MSRFDDWKRAAKNYKWFAIRRIKRCDRERFSSHWALSRAEFSRKTC